MTHEIRRCKICTEDYSPTNGNQKYCVSCKNPARRETNKKWADNHRDNHRYRSRKYSFVLKTATWESYFDGKFECQYEGDVHPHTNGKEFDLRILQMHHKNGDGMEHRIGLGIVTRRGNNGIEYYRALKNNGWPKIEVISLCPTHHAILHLFEKEHAD
jgi:hypothetical protein